MEQVMSARLHLRKHFLLRKARRPDTSKRDQDVLFHTQVLLGIINAHLTHSQSEALMTKGINLVNF